MGQNLTTEDRQLQLEIEREKTKQVTEQLRLAEEKTKQEEEKTKQLKIEQDMQKEVFIWVKDISELPKEKQAGALQQIKEWFQRKMKH